MKHIILYLFLTWWTSVSLQQPTFSCTKFCKGGEVHNMCRETDFPLFWMSHLPVGAPFYGHAQSTVPLVHHFFQKCVLFLPNMAPKWLKVVVRGVNKTKKVRTAGYLATTYIIALHQVWENRHERIRFYFATVYIINNRYCPYFNA